MAPGIRDVVVVGGGVVGTATALALAEGWRAAPLLLEAEDRLAAHQSGHNSGVIHAGLYYAPGSLKARTCTEGREALFRLCEEEGIAHRRCGKLVVATRPEHLPRLDELERRGQANGLRGLTRLCAEEIAEREPHAVGLAGLWVAETGVVDYREVTRAYARRLAMAGGEIQTGARVLAVVRRADALTLETTAGPVTTRALVGCAGAGSDRLARLCGLSPDLAIVPFRGDYHALVPAASELVRGLIYPVPDPAFPFLGVHFTRRIDGRVEVGPNAVLALARERYGRLAFVPRDAWDALTWPGLWRLVARHGREGLAELHRAFNPRAFAAAARELVPAVRREHLEPAGCGVRAQAVDRRGKLVDDFAILEGERSLHVVNAPSPGATASLAIGRTVAGKAADLFGLAAR
ncbi:MAG TPA: L-2-hydroxyglutarate oxidase [Thermoanaerobaculia bacterium]|nr:L-2-hydroxyglutarate oxidase [Thermoanaerobaculia bacterium]